MHTLLTALSFLVMPATAAPGPGADALYDLRCADSSVEVGLKTWSEATPEVRGRASLTLDLNCNTEMDADHEQQLRDALIESCTDARVAMNTCTTLANDVRDAVSDLLSLPEPNRIGLERQDRELDGGYGAMRFGFTDDTVEWFRFVSNPSGDFMTERKTYARRSAVDASLDCVERLGGMAQGVLGSDRTIRVHYVDAMESRCSALGDDLDVRLSLEHHRALGDPR